jgi:hypothetical protein
MGRDDVDWIHLAEHRGKWRAVVYTVLNFVSKHVGNVVTR